MNDREKITRAMAEPDRLVIRFRYVGSEATTERTVSPVRWTRKRDAFVALCLGREACRTFRLDRCQNILVGRASDVLMPVNIETIDATLKGQHRADEFS